MFRIGLFLLTNLAIIVVASISLRILGFESILANNGMDLDLSALLVFCAVFGFMGSFISLLMSKFLAKKSVVPISFKIRLMSKSAGYLKLWPALPKRQISACLKWAFSLLNSQMLSQLVGIEIMPWWR